MLDRAMNALRFSARARHRILKVGRTITDLKGEVTVGEAHIAEAVTYRTLDRRPPLLELGRRFGHRETCQI